MGVGEGEGEEEGKEEEEGERKEAEEEEGGRKEGKEEEEGGRGRRGMGRMRRRGEKEEGKDERILAIRLGLEFPDRHDVLCNGKLGLVQLLLVAVHDSDCHNKERYVGLHGEVREERRETDTCITLAVLTVHAVKLIHTPHI